MTNVNGRWALITGAARGIGRLTALFMAEQGCNLILHSRDLQHTESLLEEVRSAGVQAAAVAAEFSELEQVKRMLTDIDAMGIEPDIVLNNAGIQIAYRVDYLDTPETDYLDSFKINTIAPAMICYHFLPEMIRRGFG